MNIWKKESVDTNININFFTEIDTSIDVYSNDNPHIIYTDCSLIKNLKYAFWTGSSWSINTVANNIGEYISLALDSNDNSCISYYDAGNNDLKYAKHIGLWNQQPNKPTITGTNTGISGNRYDYK